MALEKTFVDDKIEIYDRGAYKSIGVRTATIIKDDGVEISRTFHRVVLNPNDDINFDFESHLEAAREGYEQNKREEKDD